MTGKVIYVSWMRLSDKTARDWYIDDLLKRGTKVEYWDVASLLFGEDGHRSMNADYLRKPTSYKEIGKLVLLPENADAKYIMLASYEGRTARLYRLLSQYDCQMYFIAWGAMPVSYKKPSENFIRFIAKPAKFAKAAYYKAISIASRRLGFVKPYNVVFSAGQVLMSSSHYATKVIPINLVDYDHYIRVKSENGKAVKGRYAVFLDINLPYQSDLKIVGMSAIEPHKYYISLSGYFSLLEEKYSIKVVIAAHPKASYSVDTFEGREIYQGLTPELVKDAEFVISHHSTSISYAVLNHKPLVFIYTAEMALLYKTTVMKCLHDFSVYLDAPILNIDAISQTEKIAISKINAVRYEEYKYSFLTTHESEHDSTRDIFLREINAH
jgi:hypothetical protein